MTTEYKTPEERVGSLVDEVRDGRVSDYLNKATELEWAALAELNKQTGVEYDD